MTGSRRIEGDWFDGTIPDNVVLHEQAVVESSISFQLCHTRQPDGVSIGRGTGVYAGTMFDLGPTARLQIGDCVLLNGPRIICDAGITIGSYTLVSWRVVLMDTYRVPIDPQQRRELLHRLPDLPDRLLRDTGAARPIHIGENVWLGFDCCVMPGVRIGRGAIIGARSVVFDDVPDFAVAAGNPARVVRRLEPCELPPMLPTALPTGGPQ